MGEFITILTIALVVGVVGLWVAGRLFTALAIVLAALDREMEMTTARDIAHRYARKAHMCPYNKHSDRHQEHSAFCDALCADIEEFGQSAEQALVHQIESMAR